MCENNDGCGICPSFIKKIAEDRGKKYGGKLTDWSFHSVYKDVEFLIGTIDGQDPTGRFLTGSTIKTANIIYTDPNLNWIETDNTFYILKGRPNPDPLPDGWARRL